jgi:hypothetical protein
MLHEHAALLRLDIEARRRDRADRRMGDAERAGLNGEPFRPPPTSAAAALRHALAALVQTVVVRF